MLQPGSPPERVNIFPSIVVDIFRRTLRMISNMRTFRHGYIFVALLSVFGMTVNAQETALESSSSSTYAAILPDAPSSLTGGPSALADTPGVLSISTVTDGYGGFAPSADIAKKYKRTIKAGQQAQPLGAGDKMAFSVVNQFTLSNLAGNLLGAGISHWDDGRPHYGVDKGAFGERLGATSLKGFTQSVFSYGIYASVFHDDPRYYVLGSGHSFSKRAIYSATRMVITRKDDGSSGVNWSRLAGITSAAALANAYYPDRDRTVGKTATSTLTSIAVGAATNELNEFIGDVMKKFHHKK